MIAVVGLAWCAPERVSVVYSVWCWGRSSRAGYLRRLGGPGEVYNDLV